MPFLPSNQHRRQCCVQKELKYVHDFGCDITFAHVFVSFICLAFNVQLIINMSFNILAVVIETCLPVMMSGFTDTNPVGSLDGHTFRLAFANMRQVTII